MKRGLTWIAIISLLLMACTDSIFQKDKKTEAPAATEFQKALHEEYNKQAEQEIKFGNSAEAEFYEKRAEAAQSGKRVLPYEVDENGLPTKTVPAFRAAKKRLTLALVGGAKEKTPYRAARAQVAYDCWWEETLDDNGAKGRARVCEERFQKAIVEIEEVLEIGTEN